MRLRGLPICRGKYGRLPELLPPGAMRSGRGYVLSGGARRFASIRRAFADILRIGIVNALLSAD